jgi:hypothetical protein
MKSFLVLILILIITIINISCSDNKQESNNQPASNNSKATQNSIQNDEAVLNSKYEFPGNNGIGPIKEISLVGVDQNLASLGNKIFNTRCISCHQLDAKNVGPPLRNVTKKNTPVYIMNYLLNTTDMQKKDPLMQKLVSEYKIYMPDQQLTRDDARAVLEYLRSIEK